MALMGYFKTKGGLPDPKGTLSWSMPSPAIAEASKEVHKATEQLSKHRPYKRYSPRLRAEIGQYASHHRVAAARYFFKKLEQRVSESTVRSLRSSYVEGVNWKRPVELDENDGDILSLPLKKRGRSVLLGPELDVQVQLYLRGRCNDCQNRHGSCTRHFPEVWSKQVGGVWRSCWAQSTMGPFTAEAHELCQEKSHYCQKSKGSDGNFVNQKKSFLADVVATVTMEEIPPDLIMNWD